LARQNLRQAANEDFCSETANMQTQPSMALYTLGNGMDGWTVRVLWHLKHANGVVYHA